ncbi:MAG: PAS domain S-box protein [Armatimonadetes bacterium]|nr:PAS domain S-box protein [Armatimonadota bacterium]
MAELLRVLLVEDNEDDAELVRRTLSHGEAAVELTRVEDEPSLRAALAEGAWDAVVADYSLPHFSAPEALAIVQETGQDLPFIVVSGTIGESTAVAMMRTGAHDYLMKDNLARLLPAVEREIAEAQVRRERRESEERFRAIFDRSAVGITVTSMDGRELDCNPAMAAMLGMTREEYLAADPKTLFHPDERDPVVTEWEDLLAGKRDSYQRETRLLHQGGHTVYVRLTVSLAAYGPAQETVALTMIEDITTRKQAEKRLRESEEQYREMFEHMSSGVAVYEAVGDGEDFLFREFNAAAERIDGVSRDELLGRPVSKEFPSAEEMGILGVLRRVWRTGQAEYHAPTYYEDTRRSGWRENFVYKLPAGQVVAIYDDVTERVEAQRSLDETRERLEALIDAAPVAVIMFSRDARVLLWNPAAERIFGWPAEKLLGATFPGSDYGERELVANMVSEVLAGQSLPDIELRLSRADDSLVDVSISASPVRDAEGQIVAAMGVVADITERAESARLLEASEERHRSLVENSPIGVWEGDFGGVKQWVEELRQEGVADLAAHLRKQPDAIHEVIDRIIVHSVNDFVRSRLSLQSTAEFMDWMHRMAAGDPRPFFTEFCLCLAAGELTFALETALPHPDGTRTWVIVQAVVMPGHERNLSRVTVFITDITERVTAEEALAAERERLAVTLRSIADCVIATDVEGRVLLLNPAAAALTGWPEDEALGRPVDEVLRLADARTGEPLPGPVAEALGEGAGPARPGLVLLRARDGSEYSVAESAAPIHNAQSDTVGAVVVFHDVTGEQALRTEALRAQKLESLGVLAGGIAHDFNNVLLVISGNLQMARMFEHGEDKHVTMLNNAERACGQARDLTQQLLTFAKGGAPVKDVAAIGDLVRDTALFALSGSNVRCELDIAPDLCVVEVDRGQISQVVNNLVINADQAMPTGGCLRIGLRNARLDGTGPIPLPAGEYVCLTVADTGGGIAPEHVDRIFDPYFTTKSTGSGLGLANCYSIVQQHGGHLGVESTPGKGSTFRIYLPISAGEGDAPRGEQRVAPTGTGRVLVMDDEAAVRELAEMLLTDLGYTVALAEGGEQALDMCRSACERGEPFAAVVLDLTIRGAMGGLETMAALRELDPEVRAVVCSGYSADPVMAQYAEHGFCAVVVKPYDVVELAEAVAQAVAGD